MSIQIRPIHSHDEYRAVEELQRTVWDLDDVEVVPDHMLLTAQENGGLLLGAFVQPGAPAQEELVGFVFGFLGLTEAGRLKHCSHMAGVAPIYQNQKLGYRLKVAQRAHVLAQGIDLITWTFDPLESRNAYLNFHKLGVVSNTYLRDLYGAMRDALNAGLPSDRLMVEWHIATATVEQRLKGEGHGPSLVSLEAAGVQRLCLQKPRGGPPLSLDGEPVLVQIPADFQAIKSTDLSLAKRWRSHTRSLFEELFGQGYVVTDMLFEQGRSYYYLTRV